MLSCIVSTIVSMRLSRESIYTLKLIRRGAHVGGSGREAAIMLGSRVEAVMEPVVASVRPNASLHHVVAMATGHHQASVYVTDHKRKLLGVVTLEDVASHLPDKKHIQRKLLARDLMHAVACKLVATERLDRCVTLLSRPDIEDLPVVKDDARLIGRVSRTDLLSYYGREVLRQDVAFGFVEEEEQERALRHFEEHTGEVRGEIPVAGSFVGRSLRQLNLRARFGVNVYAMRRGDGELVLPDAGAPLAAGAVLIVIGPEAEVERVRNLASE